MFGMKNGERPWQDELPQQVRQLWLDADPEIMTKLPFQEECIDQISINCHIETLTIFVVAMLGGFDTWGFRIQAYRDMSLEQKLWRMAIVILVAIIDVGLGRRERGYIAIYPEMMIFYLYDKKQKRARPASYHYWEEVVQYSKRYPAIWFGSENTRPYCPRFKMKKLRPYLEQYAPQAKAVTFNVAFYLDKWDKKADREKKTEYKRQIKGYNEKKKALIEDARQKAREQKQQAEEKNSDNMKGI